MKRRLQVFVSSTFTDLVDDRQAAVAAILKSGHIPAGMELFAAGNESQMQTIQRWIDESDVFMLILGGRYGSLEPHSQLSYTELEYDHAVAKGKPFFAVVLTDAALERRVKASGTAVLEKDNPQKLKAFREKVLNRMSAFFDDERDIRLAVHETLSDFVARHQFSGWVSGADVPDAKALVDRISALTDENERLSAELVAFQTRIDSDTEEAGGDPTFAELEQKLSAVAVAVPEKAQVSGGPKQLSALQALRVAGERLVIGLHNSFRANDWDMFLIQKIVPKLQLYELADSERVSGVGYRRFALTKKGSRFLRYLQPSLPI